MQLMKPLLDMRKRQVNSEIWIEKFSVNLLGDEWALFVCRSRVINELINGIIALKGIYAIDMQANCVGIYWDEEADLRATQLDEMKAFLHSLAER